MLVLRIEMNNNFFGYIYVSKCVTTSMLNATLCTEKFGGTATKGEKAYNVQVDEHSM